MVVQSLLVFVLVLLSALPILVIVRPVGLKSGVLPLIVVLLWLVFPFTLLSTAIQYQDRESQVEDVPYRPIEVASDGYVGAGACRSCHPHNHATWHASYHRTMTQVATPQSVLGDFDDIQLRLGAEQVRLFRHQQQFWFERSTPVPLSPLATPIVAQRPVVLTTGSHHLQAYWFPLLEDSRFLTMSPFVYLKEEQQWVPSNSTFLLPPNSPADEAGRWNRSCIVCHATHGQMRPAGPDNFITLDSRVAEFGISCEACHGPGEAHVRTNRDPTRRYSYYLQGLADPTIVNPARLPHDRSSEVCGQCHGVFDFESDEAFTQWTQYGYSYRPGDVLSQSTMRFLVRTNEREMSGLERNEKVTIRLEESFWPDGMIRIAGREFNGLVESPCYQRGGLSCLSCHRQHQALDDQRSVRQWANDQLDVQMHSNLACTQCHPQLAEPDQLTSHTHHAADSSGSDCYNCHMPYTTYGLLKAIRSHEIDSPNLAASVKYGRPNACNQCHLDRTLAWTADHLRQWYAIDEGLELSPDQQSVAASVLWLLRGDAALRALMAWSYGWEAAHQAAGTTWLIPYLAQLLEDPYDAVRYIAGRSLHHLPAYRDWQYNFIAPRFQRSQARRQAMEIWLNRATAGGGSDSSRVLLGRSGELMQEEFERLLRQRDDRPMSLAE